jgi:hypothetical protein
MLSLGGGGRRRRRAGGARDTESKTRTPHKDVGNEKQVCLISMILQAIYIFILTISNFPIHCCTFFIMVHHFFESFFLNFQQDLSFSSDFFCFFLSTGFFR